MKSYLGLITVFLLFLAGCASTADKAAIHNSALDDLGTPSLIAFESDREFRRYLNAVKREERPYNIWWASNANTLLAQAECVNPENCEDEIIVTATKKSSSSSNPTSITNTQNFGVDEGDIVKEINGYLIVLQDGRLFSVAVSIGHRNTLAEPLGRCFIFEGHSRPLVEGFCYRI